jgi:hypothetical protein
MSQTDDDDSPWKDSLEHAVSMKVTAKSFIIRVWRAAP